MKLSKIKYTFQKLRKNVKLFRVKIQLDVDKDRLCLLNKSVVYHKCHDKF